MKQPSPDAQSLLALLVRHIDEGRFRVDLPSSFLGYGEALEQLKIPKPRDKTHGEALNDRGLSDLANWAKAEDHPAVSGLVINKEKRVPGSGFWTLYGKDRTAGRDWWLDQIAKALKYNWKPFLRFSDPPPPPPAPIGESVADPPGREMVTISRIIRDSERAARVKLMHGYLCQFGCPPLELKDGTYYAEAHHVKPLGKGGPDVIANIMCVCPNHHALLDLGAIPIDPAELRNAGHHEIAQEFIDHHNNTIFSR